MKNTNRKYVWPMSVMLGLAIIGVIAAIVAMTPSNGSIQAQDDSSEPDAMITVTPTMAEPGDTITVRGSNFRVGTEASFIYTSTITIGGMPIASVASVEAASGFLHAGRTSDSGTYIAEHIDIDPADTTADGAFTADFVLPNDLPAGKHVLQVTSCWGGPDDAYPEDWALPCGRPGLGGGVNDHIAKAFVTVTEPAAPDPAVITVTPSSVEPGGTITVSGSDFREGEEASFIYVSTITIGGMPIADVENAVTTSASIHEGRTTDSGLYIARHIDIDPAGTTADGEFTVDFVLPDDVPAGKHVLQVTSCWGGPDDAYPEDWAAPCGTPGLGGGVNDHIAKEFVTVTEPAIPDPVLTVSPSTAEPGDTITVRGSGFRMGTEASFIYTSTITIGGVAIGKVASVDLASGFLHAGRTTDSGAYIAEHIDIDPSNTTPDGVFIAEFVLPYNLSAGEHELKVISCWGGPDGDYPSDGADTCGTPGLGGGVNDDEATATITIREPASAPPPVLTVVPSTAGPGDTILVRGSGFRAGEEVSFIYTSTITVGDMPIASVASVDLVSGYLHARRPDGSGGFITEHIDIDPTGTVPDGAFIAEFVLPYNLSVGDHELKVTACWGGADGDYPQLGADTCGTAGLGGGVDDRVATAMITIE